MLPDYPEAKRLALRRLNRHLRSETARLSPILAEIPRIAQHEGDSWAQGDLPPQSFQPSEAGYSISREEMMGPPGVILRKYSEMAASFAEIHSKELFATVTKAAESVGNVVSAKGEFTQEKFLELLGKLEADLDPETHEPINASFVVHPETAKKIIPLVEEWDRDPDFKRKVGELKERQWEAFLDRESRRRLVD